MRIGEWENPYWPKLELQQIAPESVCRTLTVRSATHKLIYRLGDTSELYDLVADPLETDNLIDMDDCADVQRQLQQALLDKLMVTSDVTPFSEDPRGHTFQVEH